MAQPSHAGAARLPGFHTCVGIGGERQESQDAAWYAEKGITYLTGTRVTSADLTSKTLTTAAGDTVMYEKLVVATGARPMTLSDIGVHGGDLGSVLYLRNEADAAELVKAMEGIKATGGKVRPMLYYMFRLLVVPPADASTACCVYRLLLPAKAPHTLQFA